MTENQTDNRMHPELRAACNRLLQQSSANTAAPQFFADVNADFNSAGIGAAREKFTEAEPSGQGAIQFCDPDWILRRGMRAEPFAAVLQRDRFKLRGGNTAGYGSIMNF